MIPTLFLIGWVLTAAPVTAYLIVTTWRKDGALTLGEIARYTLLVLPFGLIAGICGSYIWLSEHSGTVIFRRKEESGPSPQQLPIVVEDTPPRGEWIDASRSDAPGKGQWMN